MNVRVIGSTLFFLVVLTVAANDGSDLSHNELIRAYCSLVKTEKFYRFYKLKENCALNVQIFRKQVSYSSTAHVACCTAHFSIFSIKVSKKCLKLL
jgi:hypothetical protein